MDPRQKRDEWLRYEYGITLEEYERRHEEQRGVCALCDRSNGARPLVVDHDHQTGEVRGLLCDRCNKALGLLEDDEVRLRRAINYVRRQA